MIYTFFSVIHFYHSDFKTSGFFDVIVFLSLLGKKDKALNPVQNGSTEEIFHNQNVTETNILITPKAFAKLECYSMEIIFLIIIIINNKYLHTNKAKNIFHSRH